MATRYSFNLGFDIEPGRAEFERERRRLESGDAFPIDESVERMLELAHALDTGVNRCKATLLATPLAWDDASDLLAAWIARQHDALATLGAERVEAMRREGRAAELVERAAAAALFHAGEALKWGSSTTRCDYASLHDLLLLSLPGDRHRVARACVVEGRRRETTLEALYFRALLLDRFSAGNLPRSQLELLDAWLWEWTAALRGEREVPGGASLRVDLDRNAGLRGGGGDPGACLHLSLEPLERLRRKVIEDLHAGRITPAHGCASELRIEEHVALLDHLARAFADTEDAPVRADRQARPGFRVEAWVGIAEILANGMNVGVETGRWRVVDLADPAIEEQKRARFGEATRRYLWQVDESRSGSGFEALETDAAGIAVGDVIAWRRTPGGPVSLGCVVRQRRAVLGGQVFIGVRLLSHAAQPLRLEREIPLERDDGEQCLFVPGGDASGRGDGFLLPEGRYETRLAFIAATPAGRFRVRFNRIRDRGRGWVLAGFEVVPVGAEKPVPVLALDPPGEVERHEAAAGEYTDDVWQRELGSRLLR